MRLSDRGIKILVELEGKKNKKYLDQAGKPTIGVGHLLTEDELNSGKIYIDGDYYDYTNGLTDDLVYKLLAQDLKRFELCIEECVNVEIPVNQHQFDALVIFAFNIGTNGFRDSSALRFLNKGKYELVPAGIRLWCKVRNPKTNKLEVSKGLINRREVEVKIWKGEM